MEGVINRYITLMYGRQIPRSGGEILFVLFPILGQLQAMVSWEFFEILEAFELSRIVVGGLREEVDASLNLEA